MSRRICVDLYNAILKLRPDWAGANDDELETEKQQACVVKIMMTGSADDGPDWQPHIRNKQRRRVLANRFKDSQDPFRIVIVRDMWLTGFDAPCLHTMYVDKPMRGHELMQAIARVNRVFRDKPGGLVVDYLGLADQLKYALATYTESGGQGSPKIDTAEAVAVLQSKHGIICGIMHGFDWGKWMTGTPAERLGLIPAGQEHVLQQENGKQRFVQFVTELSRAFALCAATDEAIELRDDIAFFQAIRASLAKTSGTQRPPEQLDAATKRGEDLGLNEDEIAFYDALAANESAVQAMGNDELKVIAAELVTQVRKSVSIDWTLRESARARIKVMVKRILKKHGYPPDLQEEATKPVLAQAELLSDLWAVE